MKFKDLREFIRFLEEKGEPPRLDELVEEVLHRCACRSSVMAGDVLSEDEIRTLLERGKARERAHVRAGRASAVANIDAIIRLIRAAPDPAAARGR